MFWDAAVVVDAVVEESTKLLAAVEEVKEEEGSNF